MHVPSDGKPLPGYQLAMADYKRRVGASAIEVAGGGAKGPGDKDAKRKGNLFAMLFGGGDEDEEPNAIASGELEGADEQPAARAKVTEVLLPRLSRLFPASMARNRPRMKKWPLRFPALDQPSRMGRRTPASRRRWLRRPRKLRRRPGPRLCLNRPPKANMPTERIQDSRAADAWQARLERRCRRARR